MCMTIRPEFATDLRSISRRRPSAQRTHKIPGSCEQIGGRFCYLPATTPDRTVAHQSDIPPPFVVSTAPILAVSVDVVMPSWTTAVRVRSTLYWRRPNDYCMSVACLVLCPRVTIVLAEQQGENTCGRCHSLAQPPTRGSLTECQHYV